VMMLNLGEAAVAQERAWLQPRTWLGPSLLAGVLLLTLIDLLLRGDGGVLVQGDVLSAKQVGTILFGPWLLVVELSALLLLAALVTASHVGRLRQLGSDSKIGKEAP